MARGGGLVVTAAARSLKREIGPTAWAVLEDVLLDAEDEDGRPVAETNVRRVAGHLGMTKDTAARAVARLIDAGLLTRQRGRDKRGFAPSRYLVDLGRSVGVTLGDSQSVRPDVESSVSRTCPTNPDTGRFTTACPEIQDAPFGRGPKDRDTEPPEDIPPSGGRRRRPSRRSSGGERPAQGALFDFEQPAVRSSGVLYRSGCDTRNCFAPEPETQSAPNEAPTCSATNADSNLSRATTSRNEIENLVNRPSDAITASLDNQTPKPSTLAPCGAARSVNRPVNR